MLNFVMSLSIGSGAGLVALGSGVLAAVWVWCPSTAVRRVLLLLVPFVLANVLYWLPVWMEHGSSESGSWAMFFLVPWCVAGLLASWVVSYAIDRFVEARLRKARGGRGA